MKLADFIGKIASQDTEDLLAVAVALLRSGPEHDSAFEKILAEIEKRPKADADGMRPG